MSVPNPRSPRPTRPEPEVESRPGGTHTVTNQLPPLVPYDAAATDAALHETWRHLAGDPLTTDLPELGKLAGSEEVRRWAFEANESPPRLRTHDRYGRRIDEVEFHPSWHRLLEIGVRHGVHAAPYESTDRHAHLLRAAKFYLWNQAEPGNGCPLSMTHAAVPALAADDELAAQWTPRLTARSYDFGLRSPAEKAGCLAGMAMTEKQGGSDVRANTTVAAPLEAGTYALTGHKWFCSAPMSDVFLMSAVAPGGLTCFVVPRVLPDGKRNVFRLMWLKDKLGNRANASAEIELDNTVAWRLGTEGRGISTIITMVAATRLDCARLGRVDATRGRRGDVARRASQRIRPAAAGAAGHDQRLGRPRGRAGGGDGSRSAVGGRCRRRGTRFPPAEPPDREVPGLQTHPGARRGGAGMPRRQRVCRGVRPAAALPGVPAELDLGGLGQHSGTRRVACTAAGAGGIGRVPHRGRDDPWRGTPAGPRDR